MDGTPQDRKVFSNPVWVSVCVIGGLFCEAAGLGETVVATSIRDRLVLGIFFLAGGSRLLR